MRGLIAEAFDLNPYLAPLTLPFTFNPKFTSCHSPLCVHKNFAAHRSLATELRLLQFCSSISFKLRLLCERLDRVAQLA
jgi:hypothetical protein